MTQWEVYIYIKGYGSDCYLVGAEDEAEAKTKAVQRVLCETSCTMDDFEVMAAIRVR